MPQKDRRTQTASVAGARAMRAHAMPQCQHTCVRLARTVHNTVYDRIFGDFPAINTVYTPYIYGSGQP